MTDWPAVLTIEPIDRASGAVCLPGSKSISNRALLLSALARGNTALISLLDADDTRVMRTALSALGVELEPRADRLQIAGCGGAFPVRKGDLLLGNSGTAFRSLAAVLAFSGGHYTLDGVARMRERPVRDLVDALNSLGARIRYGGLPGFPPLVIEPADPPATRDQVSIRADVSSQFLSGLLLAAPLIASAEGLRISVEGRLISEPYVELTLAMMKQFGAKVSRNGNDYLVSNVPYQSPGDFVVEGDASSASYFIAAGAIAGGPVRVDGVGKHSVQGDVRFPDMLSKMGADVGLGTDHICITGPESGGLRAIDADCTDIPDAAMTLAVVTLFADGPSTLRNIGSWRVKETDRISAMATELRKVGAQVNDGPDWMRIVPPVKFREATIDTYDDHRMAMCFSLVAAGGVPVHIRDPGCVSKTFPDYFDRLAELVRR